MLMFQVADRLADFRELVREIVKRACANALFEAGFPLDEGSGYGSPDPGRKYIQSDLYYPRFLRSKFNTPYIFEVQLNLYHPQTSIIRGRPRLSAAFSPKISL